MADERVLKAQLRFDLDKGTITVSQEGVKKVEENLKKAGKAADDARQRYAKMREEAEKLQGIGMRIGAIGASILAPLGLSLNQYIQKVGVADATSRKWLESNQRIEDSQIRIGKVVADQLLPFMETAAELAEKMATFLEENPDVVKAALVIGGGMAAAGGGLALAAQIKTLINALGSLGILKGGAAAAGAAGAGGAAGGVALAGGAGVLAGGAIYDFLAKNFGLGGGTRLSQFATVGAYGLGQLFGGESQAKDWAKRVGDMTNAFDQAAAAAEKGAQKIKTTSSETVITQAALTSYERYRKAEAQAQKQYDAARIKMTQDTEKQIADAETRYGKERVKLVKDTAAQQAKEIADFDKAHRREDEERYAERAKRARDFGIEVEQAEANHQKEMRRMAEDHQTRMEDAIANNDAMAAFQEMRSYERERGRAEEDYSDETAQRNAQYAQELDDDLEQTQKRRSLELADFEERMNLQRQANSDQLAEMDTRHQEEIDGLKTTGAERLDELKAQYDEEKGARDEAFREQMAQMGIFIGQTREMWNAHLDAMKADLQRLMSGQTVSAQPDMSDPEKYRSWTGLSSGGYMPTVAQDELASLRVPTGTYIPGGSSGTVLQYSPTFVGMGKDDQAWYQNIARNEAEKAVSDLARRIARGRR